MSGDSRATAPAEPAEAEQRALRGFLLTATALLTLLFLAVGSQSLSTRSGTQAGASGLFASIWPQHWSFFSDYADDGLVVAYAPAGDGAGPRAVYGAPLASVRDDWGLVRGDEAETMEAAYLASTVPASRWVQCGTLDPADCLERAAARTRIALTDRYPASGLCGDLTLAVEGPEVPATRADQGADGRMLRAAVSAVVNCG